MAKEERDGATLLEDLKDHSDELVNASTGAVSRALLMKIPLVLLPGSKTSSVMISGSSFYWSSRNLNRRCFRMAGVAAERRGATQGVESHLPLRTAAASG